VRPAALCLSACLLSNLSCGSSASQARPDGSGGQGDAHGVDDRNDRGPLDLDAGSGAADAAGDTADRSCQPLAS
jgi:hypothetical protein